MTKVPSTPAELTEFLLSDPKNWPDEVRNKAGLQKFIEDYGQRSVATDPGIKAQIKEQMQATLGDFLRENKDGATAAQHGPGVPLGMDKTAILNGARAERFGLYNKAAVGAELDKHEWAKTLPNFFRTIWHNAYRDDPSIVDARRLIRNAMSERVPGDGGFLVPEGLRSDLLRVALENSIVRPRARIIPMETLRVPYPGVDDTSHASNVYGGVTWNWTEEAASISASQPSFLRVVLEAKKLTLYTEVPNELLADAISTFQQFISEMFPEAMGFGEDDAFINGSGQGEPQGYLNSPCAIVTGGFADGTKRNTASHVKFSDIAAMFPKMLPSSVSRAVWVCSPGVIADLLQLALATGDATTTYVAPPLWLTNQSAAEGPTWQLLGRPLYVSEKHPALGSAGDLAFVDLGYYLLGDRQVMQATSSEHFKFQNDMTAIRVVERVDGRTWTQSAITAKNGTDKISPVVVLGS